MGRHGGRDRRPSRRSSPARARMQPGDRVDERALAGAVRADDGHDLAVAHRRARRPRPRGRRRSAIARWRASSSMASCRDRPRRRAAIAHRLAAGGRRRSPRPRSAPRRGRDSSSTARITCSTKRMVDAARRGSRGSGRWRSRSRAGLRPDSTSSSRMTRGRAASARASSRNLRSCRFSSSGSAAARRPRPVNVEPARGPRRAPRPARTARGAEGRGERHVVERGEVGERPRDLVGARHAEPRRSACAGRPVSGASPSAIRPRSSRVVAADHVDERGLARAVRADEPDDLARRDG